MAKKTSASESPAATKKLPPWITTHFTEALDSLDLLMKMVTLSERGIRVLRGMPKLVKVLADVKGKAHDAEEVSKLQRAEAEAQLAATETEKDYPVLHGFAVVALWSWLEHSVKGFLSEWLVHRRDALNAQPVQRLRVKLGDYLQLSKAEQAHFLVELLEQDLGSGMKRGASRFDSLLDPFGLSFPLNEKCRITLFELQQVRNALAHRNGRTDRRLRSECPWLKLKLGQPVCVSHKMLGGYAEAVSEFLLQFLYRVGDVYDLHLRPEAEQDRDGGIERKDAGESTGDAHDGR